MLDVLKLDPVLERAEREIMAYEGVDRPPRVIFDDPNYPAVAPNSPEDIGFADDWSSGKPMHGAGNSFRFRRGIVGPEGVLGRHR